MSWVYEFTHSFRPLESYQKQANAWLADCRTYPGVDPEGRYCTVSGVGLGAGLLAGGSEGFRLSCHVERSV